MYQIISFQDKTFKYVYTIFVLCKELYAIEIMTLIFFNFLNKSKENNYFIK